MPTLRITRQVVGHRVALSVIGEVDVASVSLLAEAIESALADGASDLWIDLSPTSFMDSAGLHLLLATRERAADLNRRLAIVAPSRPVQRLFDVAGVSAMLPLYADRPAAHRAA
jgi:anti-anti-sigma factor